MLAQTCVAIVALLGFSHAKPTTRMLQHDDVIVAGSDGSIVVMKDYEYGLKEARETLQRKMVDPVRVATRQESHANQRRCDESVEYQVLSVSRASRFDCDSINFPGQPPDVLVGQQVIESCVLYNSLSSSTAVADPILSQDTNFNDWDVAMSPVVGNIGSTGASVAVSKGYSVANSAYVRDHPRPNPPLKIIMFLGEHG